MQLSKGLVRTVALAAFVLALAAPPARAQFGGSTGGIAGRVADEQGGALPGVSVTIKGPGAPQTVYTNARGEFHVINLAPGEYSVSLALQGFAAVERENVAVTLGRDTELALSMTLSAVAATVTVSGEVPVISTRKVESSTAITPDELKSIPTARDPWVVLQSIPGVEIDRVNVAGSESGQQSSFVSKGSTYATFTLDGVNLTDYRVVWFQELQLVSGGVDATIQGSGAHL